MAKNVNKKDIGKKYGFFTVIDIVPARSGNNHYEYKVICICGKESYSRKYMLENNKHISCGCKGVSSLDIGDTYGEWTIIEEIKVFQKGRRYKCLCSCGIISEVGLTDLRYGKSKKCYKCSQSDFINSNKEKFVPYKRLYGIYKRNANKNNREFSLTFDEAVTLFTGKCYYCGVEPEAISSGEHGLKYNGIDRKDNKLGYIIKNCLSCCYVCNRAKNSMEFDRFIIWINRLKLNAVNEIV